MKRKFKCPICRQPKYKKELFTRSMSVEFVEDGVKCVHTFKRTTCAGCNKSRWVTKSGFVLIAGD